METGTEIGSPAGPNGGASAIRLAGSMLGLVRHDPFFVPPDRFLRELSLERGGVTA